MERPLSVIVDTDAGFIQSNSYPENYTNNLDCTFSIAVEAGRKVALLLEDVSNAVFFGFLPTRLG